MRRALACLLFIVIAVCVCSCGRSPSGNAGSSGQPAAPAGAAARSADLRIVVLSPALAITLRDLGLADKIVGRHGYDMVLDKSVPVCGDQAGIDYEALLRVNPTHIVLQWGARELPPRLVELAAQHEWIVQNVEVLTLNDIRTSAVELADTLIGPDHPRTEDQPPRQIADASVGAPALVGRMNSAFRRRSDVYRGRVLLLLSASPASAVGPGSFHHQVLDAIGGTPALDKGGPYQEMDTEDVINLAPEGIVLLMPRAAGTAARTQPRTAAEIDQLLGSLAGKPIPAVLAGRVAVIDDPLCLMPGSSMAVVAEEMVGILRGWAGSVEKR